jgi:hypothetical protein
MVGRDRALVWYLRGYGAVLLAALPFTIVPTSWLAGIHEWLGLGPWPATALLEYLARSASAIYALVGGMAVMMSFDVRGYRPLILLLGWVSVPGSVYLLVLDLALGFPWWWVLSEGPVVLLTGVALLVLAPLPPPRGNGGERRD